MSVLFTKKLAQVGELQIRPLDMDQDIEIVHQWVTSPRGKFWMMQNNSLEMTRASYQRLVDNPHYQVYMALLDSTPIGLLEAYDPRYDEVAKLYPVEPGDVGAHMFLAPIRPRIKNSSFFISQVLLIEFICWHYKARRVVLEPDINNQRAVDLSLRIGFKKHSAIKMSYKTAQLLVLEKLDI